MSDPAIIATPIDGALRGVYVHHGGEPPELGLLLQAFFLGFAGSNLATMTTQLIDDHPGGWSRFEWPAPSSIHGVCFCHSAESYTPSPDQYLIFTCTCLSGGARPSDCSPELCKWIYVLRPEGIKVLRAVPDPFTGFRKHVMLNTWMPWGCSPSVSKTVWEDGMTKAGLNLE